MPDKYDKDFLESLPSRIDTLKSQKIAAAENDPEAIESIQRLVHILKGSGGLFGYDEITNLSRKVTDLQNTDGYLDALDLLITELESVIGEKRDDKLAVLLIEDDATVGQMVKARLEETGRTIHLATTGAEANELLEEYYVGLILLDLVLPDIDGRNFLVSLRQRPAMAGIPVIITSGKEGAMVRAECYSLGADGYFVKPFDFNELSAAVSSHLEKVSINNRESRTDPLTGLANRAALTEGFDRIAGLASRTREDLSIAILDIDKFKDVNDTYGHQVGDDVLKALANHLRHTLRVSDIIGRWGGEEFVIIFPGVNRTGSKWALEKSLEQFREISFDGGDGNTFFVTFSGGVVNYAEDLSLDETVSAADKLLYQAKDSGRNRVLIEDDEVVPAPKLILFAEDDKIVAKFVMKWIEEEGWEVNHYLNGQLLYNAASGLKPSLVLLDINMPVMDGYEVLVNLRKMSHYRKAPIVMLTSMGSEDDIVKAFDAGAIDYIMKPFSPVELVARLRRLMKE